MEHTIKPFPGPQEKFLSAGEDIVIFGGSVGGGKDCAVSEEIYTLNRGWILFGDIKEGDIVFDRFGKPSKVLIVSEIRVPSVCYKLYFSNGSSITASSDHWWITSTIAEVKKKEESVKTSQEIFDTLMVGDKPNHQLVAVKALRRKSRNLIKYYIKKMEVVASVPCRCITVDSLDSTYLIGRSFIPTHNSFSLLLDIYRYTRYKNFVGVIFRREMKQVVNAGGLWDKAMDLYGQLGAIPNITERSMKFPLYEYDENGTLIDIKEGQGGKIQFGHLNEEKDKFSWQGAEIPYIAFDELTHFCLTSDTDVLTDRGWVKIDEVTKEDKVPTLTTNGDIEIQPVLDTYEFDYSGDLINVYQSRGVSARMTPNHNVPVLKEGKHRDSIYKFVKAEQLCKYIYSVYRTGYWKSSKEIDYKYFDKPRGRGFGTNSNIVEKVKMDDWLEFFGWYLSEGSAYSTGRIYKEQSPCVSIRQTKPNKSLRDLVYRLGWRVYEDGEGGYKIYSRQLYSELKPLGNCYQKRIPRYIFELSARQQKIFFDAFVQGDGHINASGGIQIGLANEGLVDDLQEMCLYLGYVATKTHYIVREKFDVYCLSVSRKGTRKVTQIKHKNGSVTKEDYSGKVYCLSVKDNHTFFIRHNGRTHWTGNSQPQFMYLLSRNRNGYNFPNLIRATCNPDPDSWVRDMLDPWIDSETGYAIPEMAGKRLWMVIEDEKFIFGETKEALLEENPNRIPKSITFIPSKITDNPYLANDESYLASLYSQDEFTRKQLMDGCWNVRPSKGLVFKPEWFTLVDYPQLPKMMKYVRGWDFAAGKDKDIGKKQKFDRTASVKLGIGEDGYIYVLDVTSEQLSPSELIKELERLAYQDGVECIVRIPQDPGQAGVFQAQYIAKNLLQFTVKYRTMNTDKVSRARAVSSKAENGMYRVLRAGWNKMFFSELEKFPPQTGSPDVVDALVEAHYEIATKASYRAVGCKVIK